MHADVFPALVEVSPGERCSLSVRVTNGTGRIDAYAISVFGLDPAWVTVSQPRLSLFPNEAGEVDVEIGLPAGFPEGHRQLSVHVRSENDPSAFTLTPLGLVALGQPRLTSRVDPSVVTAGSEATFGLLLHNEGNTVMPTTVTVIDPEEKLDIVVNPSTMELQPGHQGVVQATVSGNRPWFGQPKIRMLTFVVDAVTTRTETVGTFVQKPRISRWVLSIMGLLAAAAVFAAVLSHTFDNVVKESKVDDKTLSQALDNENGQGGGAGVPTNPAVVTGKVTLQSTGAGVAGVQADLYSSGNTKVPIASAATTDTGAYTFGRLNTGKFKIRLTGAGFNEIWYPDAPTAADGEEFELEAGKAKELDNVVLGGRPGSVSGTVEAADLTGITASLVVPGTVDPTGQAEVATVAVSADGAFLFETVPSPANYQLIVSKVGYSTEIRDVVVGPAAKVENIDVVLRKGDGQIAGSITDTAGPLGGVTVEATDGTTKISTVSLTDGLIGAFTLRALTTPQIYTLTISKDGYTPETRTVDLTSVKQLDIGTIVLSRSTGSIAGVVSQSDTGPVGGVRVVISSGDTSITTFTASSGELGSYFVDDLPVPATYTITFSRSDLNGQVSVQDLDPIVGADVTGVDVALVPATSAVGGIVRLPNGTPVAGATVVLQSSDEQRTLFTADTPLGRFSFSGVRPGEYTLTASQQGTTQAILPVNVIAGEAIDRDIMLTAQASVRGSVVLLNAATGQYEPLANAVIRLFRPADFPGAPSVAVATVNTAADGTFVFSALEAPQNFVVAAYTNSTSPDPLTSALVLTQPSAQVALDPFRIQVLF